MNLMEEKQRGLILTGQNCLNKPGCFTEQDTKAINIFSIISPKLFA